jgi:hypothetical protein
MFLITKNNGLEICLKRIGIDFNAIQLINLEI